MAEFSDVDMFAEAEFIDNPEPRCPCLLLLDASGSMQGRRIDELNAGIKVLKSELEQDRLAAKRVEIAVVSFGPVEIVSDFTSVDQFAPPSLRASGDTPMGAAIIEGLEMISRRKETYKRSGISYYRPWAFLITDGAPTDAWQSAAEQVHTGERLKSFMFFAVGVEGADMTTLQQISERAPLRLRGLQFKEMFTWLSSSLSSMSRSNPGDEIPLQNPTAPDGWATVG